MPACESLRIYNTESETHLLSSLELISIFVTWRQWSLDQTTLKISLVTLSLRLRLSCLTRNWERQIGRTEKSGLAWLGTVAEPETLSRVVEIRRQESGQEWGLRLSLSRGWRSDVDRQSIRQFLPLQRVLRFRLKYTLSSIMKPNILLISPQ